MTSECLIAGAPANLNRESIRLGFRLQLSRRRPKHCECCSFPRMSSAVPVGSGAHDSFEPFHSHRRSTALERAFDRPLVAAIGTCCGVTERTP